MPDDILIIGGGFAGLTAGVALAGAGRQVRVLEQKPYLGGRARSFRYGPTGSVVDNGQHIFMGCYHATLQFFKTIGTAECIRFQPALAVRFMGRKEGLTSLVCPRLAAPWYLVAGVLRSSSFSLPEKLQILRVGRALGSADACSCRKDLERLTVDDWMASLGQSEKLRRNFWDLLCIAALNEDSRIAAASVFEPVLRLALFRSFSDSRIGLASVGLSEGYTEAAASYIGARGGAVELECNVTGFILSEGDPGEEKQPAGQAGISSPPRLVCKGVHLSDGSRLEAKTVLSAVPPFEFLPMLPAALRRHDQLFAGLAALRPAPIISINLWFDREITDQEFLGLRGTTLQWLFNKGRILGSGQHYITLVISGAHQHIQREKGELLELALGELRELFPAARAARLTHSLVIKERFATFSPSVEVVALRPPALTPVHGLYLAGDWTRTGLPATIEGAVKSGYTAAAEILRASG